MRSLHCRPLPNPKASPKPNSAYSSASAPPAELIFYLDSANGLSIASLRLLRKQDLLSNSLLKHQRLYV